MRTILAGLVAVTLHAPAICVADVLTLTVTDGELSVLFGLDPFRLSSPFTANGLDVEGTVTIVSGSLLSQSVDVPNGLTSYAYGPGLLTLDGSGHTDDGTFLSGHFVAATEPFQIVVREGADMLFGGGLADDFAIGLGSGLFDPALAQLLRVQRHTSGGSIVLGLEAIDGDPDTRQRQGFDHRGFAELEIGTTSVPEPTLLGLGLTSAIGWMALQRRMRGQMQRTGRVM